MFPNLDELAHGDKEPIPATVLLELLPSGPSGSTEILRRAEELYGLRPEQTISLLRELRRDGRIRTDTFGRIVPSKLEK